MWWRANNGAHLQWYGGLSDSANPRGHNLSTMLSCGELYFTGAACWAVSINVSLLLLENTSKWRRLHCILWIFWAPCSNPSDGCPIVCLENFVNTFPGTVPFLCPVTTAKTLNISPGNTSLLRDVLSQFGILDSLHRQTPCGVDEI